MSATIYRLPFRPRIREVASREWNADCRRRLADAIERPGQARPGAAERHAEETQAEVISLFTQDQMTP